MEYEMTYHHAWTQAVETARTGLNASLLVEHPDTGELFVNFDPDILELIQEAKYMNKLQLSVPKAAVLLCKKELALKDTKVR